LFRKLVITLVALLSTTAVSVAADDPVLAKLDSMPLKEIDAFIGTVTASVGQDSLKMRGYASTGSCLELARVANSFALGYGYLAEVRDNLSKRSEREAQVLLAKAVQSRVVTFASRVRAEEWYMQRCRDYEAPAEHADDPRYMKPAKITNPEYTTALIEGRVAAETNLAIAAAAGNSGQCPAIDTAIHNIALLVPYLDRLLKDTARRPEVLGPRASRRGLEVSRRQLIGVQGKLQSDQAEKCRPPARTSP
jgi:hypothetical protein